MPILFQAYGYLGKERLSDQELLREVENLYPNLSDPVFNVCDIDTLINVIVVQECLKGHALKESEVKQAIVDASKKDRRKFQILPDRHGKNRFLKIKLKA